MQYYPFDSRNSLYRDKFGALAEGETLRLRLLLHNDAKVHTAFLQIKEDSATDLKEIRMTAGEYLHDYRFYTCEITLSEGLYWYSFRYTSDYGEFFVKRSGESLGIVSAEGDCWQQTVYSFNFKTPDWLAGGIIYQIFPDRFYSSKTVKDNIPDDRFICADWEKQPEFRQTHDKCRLCNDYYGGDLKGIELKLDYLKSLGVNCIYLNPIFEAHSNHRYNTADYMKIDPMLGTEKDLESLIKKAKKSGINVIFDGVFSHTGDDSIYFNKYDRYNSVGAYNSPDSPYYGWYKFSEYPNSYSAWWGVPSLPETDENDPSYLNFITGENGVIRHWLKKGFKGIRLDVADELPDEILDMIRVAVKSEGEDNYILGEVWEDASNKISYGARRRFLRGKQLDSVMNYPFADAIVRFLAGENASVLMNSCLSILENYPKQSVNLLMNHIGTHDTARILNRLAGIKNPPQSREEQAVFELSEDQYRTAVKLLKLAVVLQFTLPGVPSIYYGDEVGMTGFGDPFCRAGFPWGKENTEILEFYKKIGKFRIENSVFKNGEFIPVISDNSLIAYLRKDGNSAALIAVNRGDTPRDFTLPDNFGGKKVTVEPFGFILCDIK